jgi:D-serine deaminase-like pyridoxal phosphate-dependent protein
VAQRTSRLRQRYDEATAHLDPPLAVVDLVAFRANAADLVRRAGGLPIRVASKSVRCRALLDVAISLDGFRGVLAFTLPEALWLAEHGVGDIVVAYPTADRAALQRLAGNDRSVEAITVMVDSPAHLDLIDEALGPERAGEIRACIDVDASWEPAGLHVGARRSPVHGRDQAAALAGVISARPGFRLVGLMSYEAQIAGLGNNNPAVWWMQRRSAAELARRRRAVVDAVRSVAPLQFVNGGGTGSLETSVAEGTLTEVAAGSGLYGPTLFDAYRPFRPQPAALFALPVVRRPSSRVATVLGGGYVASGPSGRGRLPQPYLPPGLRLGRTEGAGEVQTPVFGPGAADLRLGDRVWFRPAKSGELCERFDRLHLIEGERVTDTVPTYRGEGQTFL